MYNRRYKSYAGFSFFSFISFVVAQNKMAAENISEGWFFSLFLCRDQHCRKYFIGYLTPTYPEYDTHEDECMGDDMGRFTVA